MPESKLNIELLKKVRARIAEFPESYNQNYWKIYSSEAPCRTAACLAGETIICAAPTLEEGLKRLAEADCDDAVPDVAGELLGLEGNYWEEYGDHLMFLGGGKGWPEPYRTMYQAGPSAAAIAFLDHIIKTGKVQVNEEFDSQ